MLGIAEKDENNCNVCPLCKQGMALACYGGWWICVSCDYIELATDWMSNEASKATPAFLLQHKNHSNLCVCKTCKGDKI